MSAVHVGNDGLRLTRAPVLVGREGELSRLLDAVARPPAVLLVEGEAGVGKSRLVHELLATPELRLKRRLVGHCHPVREAFPFGPVLEALQRIARPPAAADLSPLAGVLRGLLPEATWLPEEPEHVSDPRVAHHRVLRALRGLLAALGPSVLVIEDAHWCDPGTAELLGVLAADLPPTLTLLLTYRHDELEPGRLPPTVTSRPPMNVSHTRVPLVSLDPAQVGELVAALIGETVTSDVAAYLHERTSGLPFAVEELVRLLQQRGELTAPPGGRPSVGGQIPVPAAVSQFVLDQVADLDDDARRAVDAVAVLAPRASVEAVAAVAQLPTERTVRGLTLALRRGVLREAADGCVAFRHLLAQDAVHGAIPAPARRHLHHRAAGVLADVAGERPSALLAHHLRAAGLTAEYVREAEAAAEQAEAAGNTPAAARFLLDALAVGSTPLADRARLAVKAGWAALYGLAHHEAIPVVQGLLGQALAPPARGELHLVLALLLLQAGDSCGADRELLAAVDHLDHRPDLKAKCLHYLSVPWLGDRPLADHMRWQDQADALMPALDPEQQHFLMTQRAVTLVEVGDPRGWEAARVVLVGRAESISQKRAVMLAAANLAQVFCRHGEYAQAEAYLARAVELAEDMDDGWLRGTFEVVRLLADWGRGRWEGLRDRADDLFAQTADVPPEQVDVALVQGLLRLAHGDAGAARTSLTTARELAELIGALPLSGSAAAGLARARLAAGDAPGAVAEIAPVLSQLRAKGVWVWAAEVCPVAVEALLDTGACTEAAQLAGELAAQMAGRLSPAAHAAVAWCRGLVTAGSDPDGAATALTEAIERWLAAERPYEAALVRERLGLLLAASAPQRAREELRAALETLSGLGAVWEVTRVCAAMRRAGIEPPYPWRGGPRRYDSVLSPREEEVARLVAGGATNREVAAALFLSPRTVEGHVARALRKLGLASREELVGALDGSAAATGA